MATKTNNPRALKAIVCLIFLLLLLRQCAHGETAADSPRIAYYFQVWESAMAKFDLKISTKPLHQPQDYIYILPSKSNLQRIEKHIRQFRDGGKYVQEAYDCDDFAREAHYWAHRWGKNYYAGMPAAVAFGTVYVKLEGHYSLFTGGEGVYLPLMYHALNVYLRNDGSWWWFEPQTGKSEPVESMLFEGVIEVLYLEL